jgi:hypothetical protein
LAHSTSRLAEVDVASLGDTELRVLLSGLTAFRPQAEIATHIATSLETFFAPQSQDICQCRELAYSVDQWKSVIFASVTPFSKPLFRTFHHVFFLQAK